MTIDEVKAILLYREAKLESINRKMEALRKELKTDDELLESVALPSVELSDMPRGSGGTHKDNADVLLKFYQKQQEYAKAVRLQLWRLAEEREKINTVWLCFQSLDEPFYSILYRLYVERQPYKAAQDEYGFSHRIFEMRRKRALELVAILYRSGLTDLELAERICKKETAAKKAEGKKNGKEYAQLEFDWEALSPEEAGGKEGGRYPGNKESESCN